MSKNAQVPAALAVSSPFVVDELEWDGQSGFGVEDIDGLRAVIGDIGEIAAGPGERVEDVEARVGARLGNHGAEGVGGVGFKRVDVLLDLGDDAASPGGASGAEDGPVAGPVVLPEEAEIEEGEVTGRFTAFEEIGTLEADESGEGFGGTQFLSGAAGAGGEFGDGSDVEVPLVAEGGGEVGEILAVSGFEVAEEVLFVGDDHPAFGVTYVVWRP